MAVSFDKETKVFTLATDNSEYQMKVGRFGFLLHIYYGRPIGGVDASYRLAFYDRACSGNPYEAGDDRTFSPDTLPLEYSCRGAGDYRIPALVVENADGSDAVDLRYASHKIYRGKYGLPGLPAVYAREEEADTLEILMEDPVSGVQAVLYYGVLSRLDVITRAVKIINGGKEAVTLKKVMSAGIDYQDGSFHLLHFHGRHAMERMPERAPLMHGVQSVGSTRGASSHQHNPFVVLCEKNAEETKGDCYGFALAYSGNFLAEAEQDQMDQTRLQLGIHPEGFAWKLAPGEAFTAPEAVMTYSAEGFEKMSRSFHRTIRDHVCRGKYKNKRRPILINNWEATYFQFDSEQLLSIARGAKELGIEMFVLDDGWFGKRDDDRSGLGDWFVNEEKLKGGLAGFVEKINDIGMSAGLWIEPEMISEESTLYREHPEWCMRIPGRDPVRSRYQLVLDISRKDCRDYILRLIFSVLDGANIEYIKWDMNRSVYNVFSAELPADRQGEVLHRYVLGLYEMQEALIERYPDLLFENCAGGGGRFDAGMLYYSPQIWCSDNTDAIERLKIQYGTSFGYPPCAMGSHVSVCPNHQTGRSVPLKTRGVVAMGGMFGYELDVNRLTDEEKETVKEQIETFKRMAELVTCGDYCRLTDPFENRRFTAWEFVSEDRSRAAVSYVKTEAEANGIPHVVKCRGLLEDALYRVDGGERAFTGSALMYVGLPVELASGEYVSKVFYLERVDA